MRTEYAALRVERIEEVDEPEGAHLRAARDEDATPWPLPLAQLAAQHECNRLEILAARSGHGFQAHDPPGL